MDLRKHARLSLQFLQEATNPAMQDLPYFWIDFVRQPPEFVHCMVFDDVENFGRWLYAIKSAQVVSGTDHAEATRQAMIREIDRRRNGPYNLVYTSPYSERFCRGFQGHHAWLWGNRSVLQGWILSFRYAAQAREREEMKQRVDAMVAGLNEFAVRIGERVYFPSLTPGRDFRKRDDYIPPQEIAGTRWDAMYDTTSSDDPRVLPQISDSVGGMIAPLVEWYELTGHSTALELAAGISRTIVAHHHTEGSLTNPIGCFSNNHGVLNAVTGVLAANRHLPNRRHLIWAKTLWEYYVARCASAFGWAPENERVDYTRPRERPSCEGCATVDMVRAGLELARAGFPESWDVVERFTRNYMTQAQIQHEVPPFSLEGVPINDCTRDGIECEPEALRDRREIRRRAVGALAGWGAPNDVLDPHGRYALCIQNCCSGHLPLGLLNVWQQTVWREADGLRINLLLDHESEDCTVKDHQPEAGRLELRLKRAAGTVRVRIPDWVPDAAVRLTVDSVAAPTVWEARPSRYVCASGLRAGATMEVSYPLCERTLTERLGGELYTTQWKGDTVVGIAPGGRFIPVFPACGRPHHASRP
jgi:hypothetical protein